MNVPPQGPGSKSPNQMTGGPGTKELTDDEVKENVRRIANGLRASSCLLLAKRMRGNKEVMARIIKGIGTGTYTRDLKTTVKTDERKHFLLNEIELLNQIDSCPNEEQKVRYFDLLIRRLIENQCHMLARLLVEAILARSNTVSEEIKSKALTEGAQVIKPAIKRPRESVLDAVNRTLGSVFGIKSAPIFPDDEPTSDGPKSVPKKDNHPPKK